MDIKLFSFILISLFQLIIALLVLLKNRKKLTNITFFLFTISLITWIFSNYFIDSIAYKVNALIMMRIIFISSGLVPFLMLLFAISLIGLKKKLKIWKVVLLSALPIISTVLCLTNLVIQDINKKQGIWDVTFGSLANIYNFYIFGYFIATLVILYLGFRKAKGLEKVRFQYVFFGLFLTVLFAVTANLVLPLIANNFNLVTIGPFATVFLTGFIAYAIIRHKLFDIRLIIARSIAFVLSIITVGLIYGFIAFRFTAPFIQNLSQSVQYAIFTILAVVLAFTFAPLRRFFEKVTNKIFFRDKYDPQALINSIGQILASEIRLDVLDKRVTHELENQMKVSSAEIVVLDKSSIYYQRLRPGLGTAAKAWPPKRPGLDIKDLMRLGKSLIIADDLQTESERKKIFEKYHISASLALKTKEEFIGFLLLGEKKSGDIFNNQDIRVMRILANELAVAIQNSKAYEEIRRFNITLRQKIVEATKQLTIANAHLKELDIAKDEFISMASHQLRTPLTTVKGYLSMLSEGDFGKLTKEQGDSIELAFDGADRMAGLIGDLLNISRMEAGRFFIDKKPLDLNKLIADEISQLQFRAQSNGVKLIYTPPKKPVPIVKLDEDKTKQVVMNLIDNAISYAPKGEVTVSLDSNGKEIVYKVSDNGIGIPKSQQNKLFGKFFRASNAQKTKPDGTGLGLYLVKRVVEDQGGEVIFESEEGKGSTFGFKLPIKAKS